MAGPRTCRSPYHNPSLSDKDELIGDLLRVFIKGSNTPTLSLTVFWAQTPAPTPAPALNSIEKLCQQLLKTYGATFKLLEQNHELDPCKQSLKAQFPNFYYSNLQMDYYDFWQQCEGYFETAETNEPNCIPFVALFLYKVVVKCQYQYKRHFKRVPMTQIKFKNFFIKNLEHDYNSICNKFR